MFDYLAVLISLVFGFAVTHVLTGVNGAINRRDRVRIDWLQMFWAFPGEGGRAEPERTAFERNRIWFFGLLLAAHLIDIPETAAKQADGLRAVPTQYWFVSPASSRSKWESPKGQRPYRCPCFAVGRAHMRTITSLLAASHA